MNKTKSGLNGPKVAQQTDSTQQCSFPAPALLRQVIKLTGEGLIERDEPVRLLVMAALSGEHLLLVGPPGTAKSELAKRLHRLFGGRYFERLLTRFSVPEELFGPLSLAALDEGRYERDIDGYLPQASIAFLDEVFKANSAILNALLTLLNEREFDQGPVRIDVPLICLVAASNELPDDETLRAFEDRFLLRALVAPVSDEQFAALLTVQDQATTVVAAGHMLTEGHLQAVREAAQAVRCPVEVTAHLGGLRKLLRDTGVQVSDRRWVRAVHLLRVSAACCERSNVDIDDLWLLKALVGENAEHAGLIENWFCDLLGAQTALQPTWATRVVEAFEQQFGQEESATELAFDDSGKLAVMKSKTGADDEMFESAAPRMSAFSKSKRYSASHIAARVAQIDQVLAEFAAFVNTGDEHQTRLAQRLSTNVFLPPELADRLQSNLNTTVHRMGQLHLMLDDLRTQYADLPVTEQDDGVTPAPVDLAAS